MSFGNVFKLHRETNYLSLQVPFLKICKLNQCSVLKVRVLVSAFHIFINQLKFGKVSINKGKFYEKSR